MYLPKFCLFIMDFFTIRIVCSFVISLVIVSGNLASSLGSESGDGHHQCGKEKYLSNRRYILYDVNPPEGFNLRRDVYIRVAVFIKSLIERDHSYDWKLVLPPWGHLYHWRSQDAGKQSQIFWQLFFDVESLRKFVPVVEMYEFIKEYKAVNETTNINRVFVLANDMSMFESGDFRLKNELTDCKNVPNRFRKSSGNTYTGPFWGYSNITAERVDCVLFHGSTSNLVKNLEPKRYQSFMFDHMEIPLHDFYGSEQFWTARRSMRYNSDLYKLANEFRRKYLNSVDQKDKTERPDDWTLEKGHRSAIGGDYLAIHMRRQDFLIGRAESVPSIDQIASQIRKKLKELDLNVVFVATDATQQEYDELMNLLPEFQVLRFQPNNLVKRTFKDGGVAIIDQIICSHARFFIGTEESTFTFRIQEDREILGFPTKTTFNHFCKRKGLCKAASQWEIIWN